MTKRATDDGLKHDSLGYVICRRCLVRSIDLYCESCQEMINKEKLVDGEHNSRNRHEQH